MLQVGVLGAGGIALRRMIPAILQSDHVVLAAAYDVNSEALKRVSELAPDIFLTQDKSEFLAADFDAVYIATPVFLHKEQTLAALAAGKHVLCEKPGALSKHDYREMSDAAVAANKLLVMNYHMREHGLHKAIRDFVQAGRLGRLLSVQMRFNIDYPEQTGNWRQTKALAGGGALMDMGVHAIDLANFFSPGTVRDLSCFMRNRRYNYEVEDSADLFWLDEEDVVFGVHAYYCLSEQIAPSMIELIGTEGRILAVDSLGQVEKGEGWFQAEQGDKVRIPYEPGNLYQKQIESFANSIQTGEIGGQGGAGFVSAMIEQAYKTAR